MNMNEQQNPNQEDVFTQPTDPTFAPPPAQENAAYYAQQTPPSDPFVIESQQPFGYQQTNTEYTSYTQQPQTPPTKKSNKGLIGVVIACSLCTALVGGAIGGVGGLAVGYRLAPKASSSPTVSTSSIGQQSTPQSIVSANNSSQGLTYREIASKVLPSVVAIDTTTQTQSSSLFQNGDSGQQGSGSGVIISDDGYIVTNQHVVDGAKGISVHLSDGTQYTATLVGTDVLTDIAILKIEAQGLIEAEIGTSTTLQVGDVVVAIGNPLGKLQGSVSQGIVSGLSRELTIDNSTRNLLQIDAAVNPGNSGGALVNELGQLVGIVNAKTSAVGVEGIGFAIPIDDVKIVIDEIVNFGYVKSRPMIGINTKDVTVDIAKNYNLHEGVYIAYVEPNSAAEIAGLVAGDVIIAYNGETIKTTAELNVLKGKQAIGDQVNLTIVRDTKTMDISLTLQGAAK